ncbi:hypothetical protein HanXRQr2_Chr01g0021211 [Helianthus annuus]|uniref:Uncharacterized protein n=1 Tax=Helianthus annuus TaxID=4232 RepID=A0A9K3JVC7_HELAN|nr:hypothetical protein HanXRQr2_Chr01g0021211 [Helianthus annuus]
MTTWHPDTGATNQAPLDTTRGFLTGSTDHATLTLTSQNHSEVYHGNEFLRVGNDNGLPILHIGPSKIHSSNKSLNISNILHLPKLKRKLLFVQKFCLGNDVFFEYHSSFFCCYEGESTRFTLLTGPSKNGLYTLRLLLLQSINKHALSATRTSSDVWY